MGYGALSALGGDDKTVAERYRDNSTAIQLDASAAYYQAALPDKLEAEIKSLHSENKYYAKIDRSVQLAILAARRAVKQAAWSGNTNFGINIGSSRGATTLFEQFHQDFQNHPQAKTATLSSPLTTLGNLAAWVGRDLAQEGPVISHSVTCSSALQSLINGVAWLRSGLIDRFLVGGSEAPLTPFTQAQMSALKITPKPHAVDTFPCRALDLDKKQNGMVLGEGAALFALQTDPEHALAWVEGIGYGTEDFEHPTQISAQGHSLQKSMRMALGELPPESIDLIVLHSPGTIQGDLAEWEAIKAIFKQKIPNCTTNKWKIGHTLGASAALSLEFALLQLQTGQIIRPPYLDDGPWIQNHPIRRILINAVGFGGNAASIIIRKSENYLQ